LFSLNFCLSNEENRILRQYVSPHPLSFSRHLLACYRAAKNRGLNPFGWGGQSPARRFLWTSTTGKMARTECRALSALCRATPETGVLPLPEADFAQNAGNTRLTNVTAPNPTPTAVNPIATADDLNPTAVNPTPTANGLNPTALNPIATAGNPIPTAVNLVAPARNQIGTANDTVSTADGSIATAGGWTAAADGSFARICRAIAGGIERNKQKVRER
jgi:hypothetical protein